MTTRTRGCTRLCVAEYGAKADGVTDDTAAFERAYAALPLSGGEVHVPKGIYLIDTLRAIRPRSNTLLNLDPGAELRAMPNTAARDYVVRVEGVHDVEIAGGRIVGDRASFVEQPNTTSEWGHGVAIYASQRVTVRDTSIIGCVGDGISVGKSGTADVYLGRVLSHGNRRQGLSIVHCVGLVAEDCTFSGTNGTAPQCGVDIEPEPGNTVDQVKFLRCGFMGNARFGLYCLTRSDGGKVGLVDVVDCVVEMNASNGVVIDNCQNVNIKGGTIQKNSATGCRVEGNVKGGSIAGVTFYQNYTRNGLRDRVPDVVYTGYKATYQADLYLLSGAAIKVGTNTYK